MPTAKDELDGRIKKLEWQVQQALARGAAGSTSGNVPANTSLMPSKNLLAYLAPGGFAVPTDNRTARTSQVVGVYAKANRIETSGQQLVECVKTNADGTPATAPVVGAPLYVAAFDDDAGAGAGRVTATLPPIGVPLTDPSTFAGGYPHNVCVAGYCTGTSQYNALGLVSIDIGPGNVADNPDGDVVLWSIEGTGWSGANYLHVPGNTSVVDSAGATVSVGFEAGKTYIAYFTIDVQDLGGNEGIVVNIDAGFSKGFLIYVTGGLTTVFFLGLGPTDKLVFPAINKAGLNKLAVTLEADNRTLNGTLNGFQAQTKVLSGAPIVPDGTCTFSIGYLAALATGPFPSALLHILKLGRPATAAERQAWTNVAPYPVTNRWMPPDELLYDPQLDWWWYSAAPAQLGQVLNTAVPNTKNVSYVLIVLTVAGAITSGMRGEQWYRNPARWLIDTEPVFIDSNGIARASPLAKIEYVSAPTLQDVFVEFYDDCPTNWDNASAGALFIDGVAQNPWNSVVPQFPPQVEDPDGVPRGFWATLRPDVLTQPQASHTIDLVLPNQQGFPGTYQRNGGYIKSFIAGIGQAFTSQAALGAKMVLVGDDRTIGQDVNTSGASAVDGLKTLIAADFPTSGGPGSVIAMSAVTRALWDIFTAPGGLTAFAHYIAESCLLGGATTIFPVILLGFNDYNRAITDAIGPWTPARFGAAMQQLVNLLGALLPPGTTIYVGTIPQVDYYAIANGHGDTLAAFNAEIVALTGCTVENFNTPTPLVWTSTPGAQLSAAGTVDYKGNIKVKTGY